MQQRRWPHRRLHGLTLIELVITIAIIAVVAAIAVPAYRGATLEAKITAAILDIKSIEELVVSYRITEGRLPTGIDEIGAGDMRDPWGNPYRYLDLSTEPKGKWRKDRNLNPINSDFDLYSFGQDGETQTQLTAKKARDDILRADDGRFIGLASDY